MTARKRTVAIVGGGPGGLAALRGLLDEGGFDRIQLFERRTDIGGVWLFDPCIASQETARYEATGLCEYPFIDETGSPRWPSPAYEGLSGNIARELLQFNGYPWPAPPDSPTPAEGEEDCYLFPSLVETQEYLHRYADGLSGYIKLNTEVTSVELESNETWTIRTRDWTHGGEESVSSWDAVILAGGVNDSPSRAVVDGLDTLQPNQVFHSKFYRGPHVLTGKKIIILGNGNSANDIAAQAAPLAQTPIYRSVHHPSFFPYLPDERVQDVAAIQKVESQPNGKITASLEDGTVITDLDLIVDCTGYRYHVPFVHIPSEDGPGDEPMNAPDRRRLLGTYKHMFHIRHPSLAFVSYAVVWTPFATAEAQGLVIARVFSGRLDLPSREEMEEDERQIIKHVGDTYKFHIVDLFPGGEPAYGNYLREWAMRAKGEGSTKAGVLWDEPRTWLLRNVVRLKTAHMKAIRERGGKPEGYQ